jgi:hypothetical protein
MRAHGHHIQHLYVNSKIVAGVVTELRNCRQLKTLWFTMRWESICRAIEEPAILPETLTEEEKGILGGLLREGVQLQKEFTADTWMMLWQWWLLVFRIPALCNLKLVVLGSNGFDQMVSPEFLRRAFSVHHNTLTTLQITSMPLNLMDYMDSLPNLKHLRTGYDPVKDKPLDKPYPQLRTLVIDAPISGIAFHNLLKYLPGLEHLGVDHLWQMLDHYNYDDDGGDDSVYDDDWRWNTQFNVSPLLDGIPSRLTSLDFFGVCQYDKNNFMTEVAFDILPSLTFLTELTIDATYPDLGRMLAKHCQLLQVLRNSDGVGSIHPEVMDTLTIEVNEMVELLENCPHLRIFDAIAHRMEVGHLMLRRPWACKDLEYFRCQLIGFERLNSAEEEIYEATVKVWQDPERILSEEERSVRIKHDHSQEQHRHMYHRLGQLRKLTTLDLGEEYLEKRDSYFVCAINKKERYSHGGRTYFVGQGPILGTMELSLASGLDHLGVLDKLQMFGFTGVDHRIQEPELEWMAKAWPRLTVMLGIHYDKRYSDIEYETVELQKKMVALRPDVKHKNAESRANYKGRHFPFPE